MRFATLSFITALALILGNCAHEHNRPTSAGTNIRGIPSGQNWFAFARSPQAQAAAQDEDKPSPSDKTARRLESFRWDPVKHKFTWDVSKGQKVGNGYKPTTTDHYDIDLDNATMTFNGETRHFSEEEAANVQVLMGVLSQYAVESTVWWEDGQGDPVDGNGNVKPRNDKDGINGPGFLDRPKAKNPSEKVITRPSLFDRLANIVEELQRQPQPRPRTAS